MLRVGTRQKPAKSGRSAGVGWSGNSDMKTRNIKSFAQMAIGFAGATLMGSWLLADSSTPKAPRGEPIKPVGVRGQPIKPAGQTPAVVPSAAVADDAAAVPGKKEIPSIGFDKLAGFAYLAPEYTGTNPPPAANTNQIPANIRAFDGQKVALKGFMLPLKVQEGKVTEMILLRDQSMCCFGGVPKLNEFVTVKMTGGGTRAVMDQAVTLIGKLKVGEFTENGYLLGIYQMDGERLETPGL